MKKMGVRILFYLGLIGIWHLVAAAQIWPSYLFPSPGSVFKTLVWGIQEQNFLMNVVVSLKRILIGYGLSICGGLILGFFLSQYKWFENTVGSLVMALQALPSICWLPAALLWFGLSEWTVIFVVIMGSLLSITIATDDGIKNIPPIYKRAALTMGAHGFQLYKDVILPAAFPSILIGLKQGWLFAWRSLLAAELFFVSLGLGQILQMGQELNDISQVVAVMIIIVIIGLVVDRGIFGPIEAHVREKWGLKH